MTSGYHILLDRGLMIRSASVVLVRFIIKNHAEQSMNIVVSSRLYRLRHVLDI